jgi:hypothetical protein
VCMPQHNSGTPGAILAKFGTHMTIHIYCIYIYIYTYIWISEDTVASGTEPGPLDL